MAPQLVMTTNRLCPRSAPHQDFSIFTVTSHTLQRNWQLDASTTTDSGSNIILAHELLQWRQLSCFGHNLGLAILKGLSHGRVDWVLHVFKHSRVNPVGSVFDIINCITEQQEQTSIYLASDWRTLSKIWMCWSKW